MKILQICHRVPYPPVDGGNIAMMNLALSLEDAGNTVHQFALNTTKHFLDPVQYPKELAAKLNFSSSYINNNVKAWPAFLNLFTSQSYNLIRFYSPTVDAALRTLLISNEFDIIQLETLYATGYMATIREHSKAKIILRAHNVEYIIWERLSKTEISFPKRKYLELLTRRLKKYELNILKNIDGLVPITEVDEAMFRQLGFRKPLLTIPLGIDLNDYPIPESGQSKLDLFHLGSMDWLPNIEGIEWFLSSCWKDIHLLFPDLKLYLAGRNFPESIKEANHPNVICEGRIENANDYMLKHQLMIVPLRSGSGMRVKIIQGLALGRTIISTTIGAEGIECTPGKNILIADTPEEFLKTISQCLNDSTFCKSIGINGRLLAKEKYSNHAIGEKLTSFYQTNFA